MIHEPRFLAGLDLGKRQDYTALAILERRRRGAGWDPVYFCQKIDWDLCVRRLKTGADCPLPSGRGSEETATPSLSSASRSGPRTAIW